MVDVQTFAAPADVLGEGPLWDAAAGRLRWIDVIGKAMMSSDLAGDRFDRRSLPDTPGSFALRAGGGMLIAYRRGIATIDAAGAEHPLSDLSPFDVTVERFNDGACDSRGRFWVGTLDRRLAGPVGSLYRLDPDLRLHRMAGGVILSNGIAWSPDDTLLYHCDSGSRDIYVYPFDAVAGTIGDRRVLVTLTEDQGRPDGCAMDVEGCLWVAAPESGKVLRVSPEGRIAGELIVPSMLPTSVAFGGEGLRTLFVTSMRPHEGKAAQPQDGKVFAADVGVAGVPRHRFAG